MISFNIHNFPKFIAVCGWRNDFAEVMNEQGYPSAKLVLWTHWTDITANAHEMNEYEYLLFVIKWS